MLLSRNQHCPCLPPNLPPSVRPSLPQVAGLNFVANWTPNLLVIFGATPDQALLLSIAVAGPMVLVTFASEGAWCWRRRPASMLLQPRSESRRADMLRCEHGFTCCHVTLVPF